MNWWARMQYSIAATTTKNIEGLKRKDIKQKQKLT
jgi:hypothetical protein